VYDSADPNIDDDVQFGVTRATLGDFVRHQQPHPAAGDIGVWHALDHTYVLEAGEMERPKPPIR
jgi:catechol 1,2-dioxygenase